MLHSHVYSSLCASFCGKAGGQRSVRYNAYISQGRASYSVKTTPHLMSSPNACSWPFLLLQDPYHSPPCYKQLSTLCSWVHILHYTVYSLWTKTGKAVSEWSIASLIIEETERHGKLKFLLGIDNIMPSYVALAKARHMVSHSWVRYGRNDSFFPREGREIFANIFAVSYNSSKCSVTFGIWSGPIIVESITKALSSNPVTTQT